MKVLGLADGSKYICLVSHGELEQYLNKYYGKLGRLSVGSEVDLGTGYDFFHDTQKALEQTKSFLESHQKVIDTIFNGIKIMGGDQ